ncbi:hypothetical protein OH76DRAFT_1098567 [Lentinus brumalis]|uniref:Uncharacterized protein n=1 Tax=Lentinus brumalis TaxID=2498619 RepID=A0A371CVV5_9APHY|nr:hypothetical protein OH76DRAFT_1098567 [Polyporus brumalis]
MAFSPPPFKVTGLNLDILQAMVVFVDERMLTLSLVSSSVWSMAIRRLLSMAPICLKDEHSIRRSHACLYVDAATRGPYVRSLDIWTYRVRGDPNRQELESLLCDNLATLPDLRTLSLPQYMYHHRGEDSDLRTTLERLSTLRELTIDGEVDYAPHTLVEKIRSPLRILRFNIIRPSSWFWSWALWSSKKGRLPSTLARLCTLSASFPSRAPPVTSLSFFDGFPPLRSPSNSGPQRLKRQTTNTSANGTYEARRTDLGSALTSSYATRIPSMFWDSFVRFAGWF